MPLDISSTSNIYSMIEKFIRDTNNWLTPSIVMRLLASHAYLVMLEIRFHRPHLIKLEL